MGIGQFGTDHDAYGTLSEALCFNSMAAAGTVNDRAHPLPQLSVKVSATEPRAAASIRSTNPCEECSLFGEIVSQVSRWFFFDEGIHFGFPWFGQAGKTPAIQKPENALVLG
jgi:hypothetical protein